MILLFAIISSYIIIISWNNNLYANSKMMVLQRQQQQHSSSLPQRNKDWNIYNLQKKYHQSGGILYKQSVLTSAEYSTIVNNLQSLMMDDDDNIILKEEDESSSFATNRIGAQISNESEIYRVISCTEGSLCRLVNNLADYVVEGGDDDGLGGRHNDVGDDDMPETSERSDDASRRGRIELGKMVLAPDIPIEVCLFLCV